MDLTPPHEDITVKIPEKYNGNTVRVIVDKERVKDVKESDFISFECGMHSGHVKIGDKDIEMGLFYRMLRVEGGLSDRIPLIVHLSPFQIMRFDGQAPCYGAKRVWPFKWKDVECSLAITSCDLVIRMHSVPLKKAVETLIDIRDEALKLWKDPKPADSLLLYTIVRQGGSYVWAKHSMRPKRKLETIYIDELTKEKLISGIEKFKGNSALYDKYGVTWKRVHIFHGLPGTGKTSTVYALASHFNVSVARVTIPSDMSNTNLESLFCSVPNGSFVLLEDADALFVERNAKTQIDFSTLLNLMDGITTSRGLTLFMTTNHIEQLDSAFLRPGRVDEKVDFLPAGENEWRYALSVLGEKWPHEHDAYIKQLLARKTPCSIAELQKHLFECHMDDLASILG